MDHDTTAATTDTSDAPPLRATRNTPSAALAVGFGSAIAAWVVAWTLHLPGIRCPTAVALPAILLSLVLAGTALLRASPAPFRIRHGLFGGLVAGLVNLLIASSAAVEQPGSTAEMHQYANRFSDRAWLIIPGTIFVGVVAGLVSAWLAGGARRAGAATTRAHWVARLALVTVFIYLPLIVAGGAVTSTESGMAVPDSFTTYGAVSVLFPFELMAHPRIFLEHSHRLFGTLAGIVTIALMLRVLLSDARRISKALAVVLFVGVCVQGYMGARRVADISIPLAIVHGVFGQLVLATAGALAATLSVGWRTLEPDDERAAGAKRLTVFAWGTVAAIVVQLALGAAARHLGHMDPPSTGTGHARLTHAAFSFVVMALILVLGARAMRVSRLGAGTIALKRLGIGLYGLVSVQFLLGWAALGLVSGSHDPRTVPTSDRLAQAQPIRTAEALITTAHQTGGALLLLLGVAMACWVTRVASARTPR